MWAPLFWEDHVSHAIFFDGPDGEPLVREGLTAPLYQNEAAIPDQGEASDTRMATARHRIQYQRGTRLATDVEIDLVPLDGPIRTIHLEPTLKFQMKGLGYMHPEWGQGMWKGELAAGAESFWPDQLDPLAVRPAVGQRGRHGSHRLPRGGAVAVLPDHPCNAAHGPERIAAGAVLARRPGGR